MNRHTHLELSHLKWKIPTGTGLPRFIYEIRRLRENKETIIRDAAAKAVSEMERNGNVAAGDISNTNISFPLKVNGKIKFHTFVEVFSLIPNEAKEKTREGIKLLTLMIKSNSHPA